MAGRVLRTHPGKPRAVILDHGGNTIRHGHPYADDPATLEQSAHRWRTDAEPVPAASVCPACFGVYWRRDDRTCPYCGALRPVQEPRFVRRAGELQRVDWESAPMAKHDDRRASDVAASLRQQAEERGHKRGWVFWQLKIRYGLDRARELMRGV
jgi:superfamily II DNA or RNA helicase